MAVGDKLVTLDGLKAVYQDVNGNVNDLKSHLLSYTSVTSKTGELATGSISTSGKINTGTTDETLYFYLVDGLASVVVSEGSLYGFFANMPTVGSASIDGRHVEDLYNTEISIISGTRYLAVRSSAEKAPIVCGKGSIQQNVFALNDEVEYINIGKEPITGTWVAGEANTSGGVSSKRNRIAINAIISYNRPITIYVDNGYMFFLRYYSSNEFVSNSDWVTDSIYVPAGQQFMITVQKYPEDLSDYATLSYGENIHVSTSINQRLIALETVTGNPWIGKKWIGFGTSLTDTTQAMPDGETGEVTGKYPAYLQALSGLLYTNYAVGGSTMCNMATMSDSTVIEQIDLAIQNDDLQTADIITIDGFVNDWYHQSDIGNLDDTSDGENNDTTIYMAMHTAVSKIATANPNALIAFIADSTGQSTWAYDEKRNGNYQYDFINAMRDFCNFTGCLFIDAGITSEINKFHPQYLGDHVHHTYIGGEQFANAIWSVLKNYKPMAKAN